MIPGNKPVTVLRYLFIDRCGEGVGYTLPKEGEKIVAVPSAYNYECPYPYIEHWRNGRVVKTVNCADVSVIIYEEEERRVNKR